MRRRLLNEFARGFHLDAQDFARQKVRLNSGPISNDASPRRLRALSRDLRKKWDGLCGKIHRVEKVCAAILAGGASRRMGTPKALISVGGQPLIARIAQTLREVFCEIVVVTSSPEIAAAATLPRIEDALKNKGPLAGIHVALTHFQAPTFCVACDMPNLNADLIRLIVEQRADFDVVVPRRGVRGEPLHALWSPACLPMIEAELNRERVGPTTAIFDKLNVRFLEESELVDFGADVFDNWNFPDDIKQP